MNKKRMIALLIVIGVIITSVSIRGTYAKYKSSIEITSDARVAKWNINTTQVVDLFKDSYDLEGIKSIDGSKIIGPGSSGSYKFEITGTAETSYEVKFDYEVEDTIKRLKYYLNDGKKTYEYNDLEEMLFDIGVNHLPLTSNEPNTSLNHQYTISWKWPLNDNDYDNKEDSDLLKNVIVDSTKDGYENQPHIKFSVSISAEQETIE